MILDRRPSQVLLVVAVLLFMLGLFLHHKAMQIAFGIPRRFATYVPEYEFPFSLIYSYWAACATIGLSVLLVVVTIVAAFANNSKS
jgi:hypothetical protein